MVAAFADGPVNQLLDLDQRREVAVQLVAVGREPENPAPSAEPVVPLGLSVEPYSRSEIEFPAMGDMHATAQFSVSDERPLADIVDVIQRAGLTAVCE